MEVKVIDYELDLAEYDMTRGGITVGSTLVVNYHVGDSTKLRLKIYHGLMRTNTQLIRTEWDTQITEPYTVPTLWGDVKVVGSHAELISESRW